MFQSDVFAGIKPLWSADPDVKIYSAAWIGRTGAAYIKILIYTVLYSIEAFAIQRFHRRQSCPQGFPMCPDTWQRQYRQSHCLSCYPPWRICWNWRLQPFFLRLGRWVWAEQKKHGLQLWAAGALALIYNLLIFVLCPVIFPILRTDTSVMMLHGIYALDDHSWQRILSLLRKGGFDIQAMFLLNWLVDVNGIAWSSFIADPRCIIIALIVFSLYRKWYRWNNKDKNWLIVKMTWESISVIFKSKKSSELGWTWFMAITCDRRLYLIMEG